MKHLLMALLLVIGLAGLAGLRDPALGDDYEREWQDDDHAYDRARRAVDRGETLPIAELLKRLKTQIPGEVVGIEFEREHGRWMYEFKIIDDSGRLLEVYMDAQTGAVLSMEAD